MKFFKRSLFANIALAALFSLVVAEILPARAQSTSVRTPSDVSGVRMGLVCDIANGWAMSTTSNGTPTCTQNVNTANSATTAQTAVTATTATTAVQAQSLNPDATVNASQLTGVIASGNLPPGGSGGAGITSCNATTFNGYSNMYYAPWDLSQSGSWTASPLPSTPVAGTVNSARAYSQDGQWYATAKFTCTAAGTFQYTSCTIDGGASGNCTITQFN